MSTPEKPETANPDKKEENREQIVSVDLPAPNGWKKKFTPKKGGTPKRNEIIFISPTGEEIRSIKQLDKYLKSHPGGASSSEFDWGTGDTPRRSARISEKAKATETPEREPPKKKEKSSSKKAAKDGGDIDKEPLEEQAVASAVEETKESADVEMKEAGDGVQNKETAKQDSEEKNKVNLEEVGKIDSDTKEEGEQNKSAPLPQTDEQKKDEKKAMESGPDNQEGSKPTA